MEKILNVGMAAYGMSGEVFHAPLFAALPQQFRLAKVVERNKQKSRLRYPNVVIAGYFDELLADATIDLVVVNTPNDLHYKMAKQALEAGKHVVVEKPFTITAAEAADLALIARQEGRVLSVFQNRRWDGDFRTVQQIVAKQMLGKLVEYEAHYDRFRNYVEANTWKEADGPGSGILYNLGSHMIDQALALFGMPTRVTADLRILRPGGQVFDSYDIRMDYGTLKVTLKSSYLVRELGPRYTLHGTEGSFLKYGIDPQEEALKAGQVPGGANWGAEPEQDWGIINTQLNGLHHKGRIATLPGDYRIYYQNIYEAIVHHKPLLVTAEQATDTARVIEAVMESHTLQKTIVL